MSRHQVDTRVTAYVFGELSPEAAAKFERELDKSSQLQEEVAATRETVAALENEFDSRATIVSTAQRETIERAIHQQSSAASRAVVLDSQSGLASHRRLLALGALAASVMIVCGLAYPYLRDGSTVSMNDAAPPKIVVTETGKVVELVETFNDLMRESRFDEAEDIAQQFNKTQPDNPISVTMLQSSRMGRQIMDREVELEETNLDFAVTAPAESLLTDALDSPPALEETSIERIWKQLPSDAGASPPAASATVELAPASGGAKNQDIAERELKQNSGKVAGQGASKNNRPFDRVFDSGMRPARATPGSPDDDALMMETPEEIIAFDIDMDGDGAGLAENAQRPRRSRGMGMEMDMEMMMEMDMDGIAMDGAMMGMGGDLSRGDRYEPIKDNPFVEVNQAALSTFSIDVDTASYAKVRLLLNQNSLPHPNAVRIEELLNYFDYDYAAPQDEHPFAASMEIAACPWNPKHRLARVGIQGKEIEADRPSSNLVFLLDVSGSMDEPNKLPLVVDGMKMLTDQLTENDKVAIVVYAGAAGLVLDATRGDKKQQIVGSLDRLKAGGSTNGAQGILLAYELARDNFIVGGTNRVILCSDGDFNVGVTGTEEIVKIAQQNAKSNIFLSVLGFGTGNHNDALMEQVSNKANGNYAFIDSKSEAKKVLVEELGGTLVTIAKDVKIQIEFNPKQVAAYRLIGYANRMLEAEDFNDDKKDAGEIGAGHTVTALYELIPPEPGDAVGDDAEVPPVDELRYQERSRLSKQADSGEALVLKLRYKQPEGDTSRLMEIPVTDSGKRFSQTDRDFKFAASVAAFGMLLRDSPHKGNMTFSGVERIAREGATGDDFGYRTEFVSLVSKATELSGH